MRLALLSRHAPPTAGRAGSSLLPGSSIRQSLGSVRILALESQVVMVA